MGVRSKFPGEATRGARSLDIFSRRFCRFVIIQFSKLISELFHVWESQAKLTMYVIENQTILIMTTQLFLYSLTFSTTELLKMEKDYTFLCSITLFNLDSWMFNVISRSIRLQSNVLLFGAAVLIPASLTPPSTTPCELWQDACDLHQRSTFQSSQASNLLSFVAEEPHYF